jgi:MFS transporter, DHA1 family, multidrug resistance protein
MDIIRDAPIGQLIRLLTRNRVLKYPEELGDFQCPHCYKDVEEQDAGKSPSEKPAEPNDISPVDETAKETPAVDEKTPDLEPYDQATPEFAAIRPGSAGTAQSSLSTESNRFPQTASRRQSLARVGTRSALQKSRSRADLERQFTDAINADKESIRTIEPEKLDDGVVVVDWYNTNDKANPQNWSLRKKIFVSTVI